MYSYLSKPVYSLAKVLRPISILWYKFMGSATDPEVLFPIKAQRVEEWKCKLADLPYLRDIEDLPLVLQIRDTTAVAKLYLCKQTDVSQHEFLVAELNREDGRRVHARIERYRGDSNLEDERREIEDRETNRNDGSEDAITRDPIPNGSGHVLSSSSSCQYRGQANDIIRFYPGEFKPTMVVKYYTFHPDKRPRLPDLAIACFVAHDYDSIYSLLLHQCYWFADSDVVCAILEDVAGEGNYQEITQEEESILSHTDVFLGPSEVLALQTQAPADGRLETIVPLDKSQWSSLKQGYNTGIKISTRQKKVVRLLRKRFDQIKGDFERKVKVVVEEANERREQSETIETQRRTIESRDKTIENQHKTIQEQKRMIQELLESKTSSGRSLN